jgi:hypothetical protein
LARWVVVRHIVWPLAQSFGPRPRRLAYRRIAGLVVWSWGPSSHRQGIRRPSASLISPLGHRLALCVVDWPAGSSLGSASCRLARRVVDWLAVLSFCSLSCRWALCGCSGCRGCYARWSAAARKEGREKSWLVLVTHRSGLPFHGSPLGSSFPFAFSSSERNGDGPTSLRREEGHQMGVSSMAESELGRRGEVVVVG